MRNLLTVIIWLCLARSDVNATLVTGHVGGSVSIKCSYPRSYAGHEKYFCKGVGWNCQVLIKTGKRNTLVRDGRFSLYDNTGAGFFTVDISGLRPKDVGKYQCAADKPGFDDPIKVDLKVEKKETLPGPTSTVAPSCSETTTLTITESYKTNGTTTTTTTESNTPRTHEKLVFLSVGLCVAVLVFGLALLVFITQRRVRKTKVCPLAVDSSSNSRDSEAGTCEYAQVKTSHRPSNAGTDMVPIYSNLNLPRSHPSSLHYASAKFAKDPKFVNFSGVELSEDPPDSVIYSNVNLGQIPTESIDYAVINLTGSPT